MCLWVAGRVILLPLPGLVLAGQLDPGAGMWPLTLTGSRQISPPAAAAFQEDAARCVTAHVLVSCWLRQTQGHLQSQYRRGYTAQILGSVTHWDHYCYSVPHSPAQHSLEHGQLAQESSELYRNLFPCFLR